MFDCRMIINKLKIDKNQMDFGVAINCPFDVDVSSPKVKVIFRCKDMDRRLPFKILNYYHQKHSDSCVIVCEYIFWLDQLFYDAEPDEPISVEIEFTYGEHVVRCVPFTVSSVVMLESPEFELDDKYVEFECFDGVTNYSNIFSPDYYEAAKSFAAVYDVEFDCDNNRFYVQRNVERAKQISTYVENSRVIIPFIRFVFFIVRTLLGILLVPWFILDGIAAALNIVAKRKTQYHGSLLRNIYIQTKVNTSSFMKTSFKRNNVSENLRKPIFYLSNLIFKSMWHKDIVPNRVSIFSGRRDDLSGNLEFVYNILKEDKNIDFQFLLFSDPAGHNKIKNIRRFLYLYSTSAVVLVDDYFRLLNMVKKRDEVKLIQLWHACGAFKTFGFTRMGKIGGPKQIDPNHRMYDYAIVSSKEIAKHYAEGFGLCERQVVATGIPRTDIFLNEEYATKVKASFYEKYPQLKNKKILLFAPTFRGNGQMSAYYPVDAINFERLYEQTGGEYAIIVKLHPFCNEVPEIPQQYSNCIFNLSSEDELNDLLFVTDLLVTDYSSVVFEASLLNIPMLFYAFDLYEYISTRDFYYDYETFVPGKIVFSEHELEESIINKDFEEDKVANFKKRFFDHLDGKSSDRVAELVENILDENRNKKQLD